MVLSYRHAFHAGGPADVLKHVVLLQVLNAMVSNPKPLLYIDSHAGAGNYSLKSGYATKLQEYKKGISKVFRERKWLAKYSPSIRQYISLIEAINGPNSKLRLYPGSPLFALSLLRCSDMAMLFELHSKDYEILERNVRQSKLVVNTFKLDGFTGLSEELDNSNYKDYNKVVLIDPSYEMKSDFSTIPRILEGVSQTNSDACYIIWYPLIRSIQSSERMIESFKMLSNFDNWIDSRLVFSNPKTTRGMYGAGMFIFNIPIGVASNIQNSTELLSQVLGKGRSAQNQFFHSSSEF